MRDKLEHLFKKSRKAIKNWWILLIAGILIAALGVVVFFFPGESLKTLLIVFGIMMIISGIAGIIIALTNHSFFAARGWNIASGALNILMGIVVLTSPKISLVAMAVILGIWLLTIGYTTVGLGGDMLAFHVRGAGWSLGGGIILMLLSFCILFFPMKIGAGSIAILLGITLILSGIVLCDMSIKLHNVHKSMKQYYTDYEEIDD